MDNFNELNLDEKILKTLSEIGYEKPTPIQAAAIPKIIERLDVIASAQTGTGKTAAFMLPALNLVLQQAPPKPGSPKVLILVPTRELALQVTAEAKKFSQNHQKIKTVCIYGGIPYPVQKRSLSGRFEILVATPGRLLDHIERGRINLSQVELFILDEADRMLDMGFIDDVEKIAAATPESRQTLLFSATIDKKIIPFSRKLQKNPFEIKVEATKATLNDIHQQHYYADNLTHKMSILDHLLSNTEITQSIIFTSTKIQSEELSFSLEEKGYRSEALHGDMNQRQRTRTINQLRNGAIQFLVATDVAARGIDVPNISHVINFDLPFQAEDFIHRVGRTGRAGAKGVAITFSTHREEIKLQKIEELLMSPMEFCFIEGLEARPREASGRRPTTRRQPPRRPSGDRSNGERSYGQRENFVPREKREFGQKEGFAPRERKDFSQKEDFAPREKREFTPREGFAPREKRDFAPREGFAPREKRDFAPREGFALREKRDFAPREKREFTPREGFAPREKRAFQKDAPPFARQRNSDDRPAFNRSEEGRPKRAPFGSSSGDSTQRGRFDNRPKNDFTKRAVPRKARFSAPGS